MPKYYLVPSSELYHHGVKGMKWGVRRYQNPDGSLTPEGRKRAAKKQTKMDAKDRKYYDKHPVGFDIGSKRSRELAGKEIDAYGRTWKEYSRVSNGGKIDNEETRALYKKYEDSARNMLNVLFTDVKLPSGRHPKKVIDENGKEVTIFV